MGSFWIILIVLFVIFRNMAKQGGKARRNQPRGYEETNKPEMAFDTSGDYRSFREPTKESQKTSGNFSPKSRTNRMMPKTEIEDSLDPDKTAISGRAMDIQERRISQHENAKKKRIHQNIHREIDKESEVTPSDLMHNIRDLIVCGYPTEIKEQRDFIKEGEDFLNSLSGDSLFF